MEIGAGGTAHRYAAVSWALRPREGAATIHEYEAATQILDVLPYSVPYGTEREAGDRATALISYHNIDTIITCNPHDSHPDHRHATSIAQQIARKAGTNLLYMDYAIPGGYDGTGPRPNLFIEIDGVKKYDALACYKSQADKYGPNWVRAVKARDALYGSQHGTLYAEGFIVADLLL